MTTRNVTVIPTLSELGIVQMPRNCLSLGDSLLSCFYGQRRAGNQL